MKKLLVTGASGFLGWNICQLATENWDVLGTSFSNQAKIPKANIVKVDLTNLEELKGMFQAHRYEAVIHTAAASDANFCQENRNESHEINVEASINIARLCADHGTPFVFISTDLVFDGHRAPYRESDPPFPVNIYGEQKAIAEEGVMKSHPTAIICRLPLMFGLTGPVASSFIQPMIRAMRQGQELTLFVDEFRTPINARTAAAGVFLALEKGSEILHLGGKERISRYDFGILLAEIVNLEREKLRPCKQCDVDLPAPRPLDVSLDSSRAFSLGFSPSPLAEQIKEIADRL